MLRHFVVLAMVALCHSAAVDKTTFTANLDLITKHMKIYHLIYRVQQPTVFQPELYKLAKTWDFKTNIDKYTDKFYVTEFLQRFKYGMLPRGEIFNMFYPEQREEAIALFRLFFYAKDFDTFYNTAAWARVNINEGQFLYALSLAVTHRPDLKYVRLPALYEIYPPFFFNTEVLEKAQHVMLKDDAGFKQSFPGGDLYVIPANYSGWYMKHDDDEEWKLNYFTEDIGLNNFYYILSQDFPTWMSSKEFHLPASIRGEQYYYTHKQFLNRYELERYSNGLGETKYFDWNKPLEVGFYSTLSHSNGLTFPMRKAWATLPAWKYEYLQEAKDYEIRIAAMIDSGYIMGLDGKMMDIYTQEGINMLGNIIEGNADSYNKRFYGSLDALGRKILGANMEPMNKYHIVPSALEYYSTSMRDPAFYSFYKRILSHFERYKSNLGAYTHEELIFPGVKIESIEVDEMMTFFDLFDANIENALWMKSEEEADTLLVKARQYRLNHKPFTVHLNINSDKAIKGYVRIFLGPKYDEHHNILDITENYKNFFELDHGVVDLKPGMNKIERRSTDFVYTSPDDIPVEEFYNKLEKALAGSEPLTLRKQLYSFPQRILIPKGRVEGLPLQMFAYISEFDESHALKVDSPLWGTDIFHYKPMGFPLDRPVYSFNFTVPNMYFKDVFIFHKNDHAVNFGF